MSTLFLKQFIFIHYVNYCFWRGLDSGLPILLELIRHCKFNFCFQPFHIIHLLTGVEGNIGYVEPEVEMSKCNILVRGPNITMLSEPLVNECFVNIPHQYICLNIWHETTRISNQLINYSFTSVRIVESHLNTVIFLLFSVKPTNFPSIFLLQFKAVLCGFLLGVYQTLYIPWNLK